MVSFLLLIDPEVHPQSEEYWGHVNPIGPRACYDEGKRVAETMCYAYMKQVSANHVSSGANAECPFPLMCSTEAVKCHGYPQVMLGRKPRPHCFTLMVLATAFFYLNDAFQGVNSSLWNTTTRLGTPCCFLPVCHDHQQPEVPVFPAAPKTVACAFHLCSL